MRCQGTQTHCHSSKMRCQSTGFAEQPDAPPQHGDAAQEHPDSPPRQPDALAEHPDTAPEHSDALLQHPNRPSGHPHALPNRLVVRSGLDAGSDKGNCLFAFNRCPGPRGCKFRRVKLPVCLQSQPRPMGAQFASTDCGERDGKRGRRSVAGNVDRLVEGKQAIFTPG